MRFQLSSTSSQKTTLRTGTAVENLVSYEFFLFYGPKELTFRVCQNKMRGRLLETLQHLFVGTWEYGQLKLLILHVAVMAFICWYVELFLGSADIVDSLILTVGGRQLGSLYSEAWSNTVPSIIHLQHFVFRRPGLQSGV